MGCGSVAAGVQRGGWDTGDVRSPPPVGPGVVSHRSGVGHNGDTADLKVCSEEPPGRRSCWPTSRHAAVHPSRDRGVGTSIHG